MTEQLKSNLEIAIERRGVHLEATKADGRQLVSIRKIDDLIPIPGADRIITAQIGGWPTVVKNGEFVPGELGLYFEPDSFLDDTDPRFAFLADNAIEWEGIRGIRLKAIKLRKQLSQGLLLPLSLFPEVATLSEDGKTYYVTLPNDNDEGQDVVTHIPRFADPASDEYEFVSKLNFTTFLGVIKWEKIERGTGGANLTGRPAGNFPAFIPKTDQPRCQNMAREIFGFEAREVPMDPDMAAGLPVEALMDMIANGKARRNDDGTITRIFPPTARRDERYEVSMKMHGSSMTAYRVMIRDVDGVDRVKFGVCSRNQELKTEDGENAGNAYVDTFLSAIRPIMELMPGNYALQGELLGHGIQADFEKVGEKHGGFVMMIYNVYDIDREMQMLPEERRDFIAAMNQAAEEAVLGIRLSHVPVSYFNATLDELGITNIQELLTFAEGQGLYQSVREGFVFKSMTNPERQFKAISNAFELLFAR
jgi:hypothetical protein